MATKKTPPKPARNPAFKTNLTLAIIKRLSLDEIPTGYDSSGSIVFGPNPPVDKKGKPTGPAVASYIIWDSHQSAPPGFGVRIAGKKTFILRRKVHGKSVMPTVGDVRLFQRDIDVPRKMAAVMALRIMETGKNPNVEDRQIAASEFTLRMCFDRYITHLTTRNVKRAKPGTLKVIKRVVKRFGLFGWLDKKVNDFTSDEITKKFTEGDEFKTANEQRFRWAIAATNWNIDREKFDAKAQNRQPLLTVNPFEILIVEKKFRDKDTIENERKASNVRNPLGPTTTLGPFLEAAWSKRLSNNNETGIHYLILMLLWGCRKSEHAGAMWSEFLPETAPNAAKVDKSAPPFPTQRNTSHVYLADHPLHGPYVFFFNTKNGAAHRMPLGTMALNLLRTRQTAMAEESARRGFKGKHRQFVFPAKSKYAAEGHYNDATDLLDRVREEVNIVKITRHDLRRSFGAVMESLGAPDGVRRRFFNHSDPNVTATYSQAEWALLREWMNKIEQAILVTAPNVYNALKPVDWPPIPAPDPHVCKPAAARTGRPSKAAKAAKEAEAARLSSM